MKPFLLFVAAALSAGSFASAGQVAVVGETPFGAVSPQMLSAVVAGQAFGGMMNALPSFPGSASQPLSELSTYMAVPVAAVLQQRQLAPEAIKAMGDDEKKKLLLETQPDTRALIADKARAMLAQGNAVDALPEADQAAGYQLAKKNARGLVAYMTFLSGDPEFKPLMAEFQASTAHWDVRLKEINLAKDIAAGLKPPTASAEPAAAAKPAEAAKPEVLGPPADLRPAVDRIEMLAPDLAAGDSTIQETAAENVWKAVKEDNKSEASERAAIRAFADAAVKTGARTDNVYKWGVTADLKYVSEIAAQSERSNTKIYAAGRLTEGAGFSTERDREIVAQLRNLGASASDRASQKEIVKRLRWMADNSQSAGGEAAQALADLKPYWADRAKAQRAAVPPPGQQTGGGSIWGRLKSLVGG